MPQVDNVGEISPSSLTGKRYKWIISDFFSLPHYSESRIISPQFPFENHTCCLGMWPCTEGILGLDFIGLNLWIHPCHYPLTLDFNVKLGILDLSGNEYRSCSVQCQDDYIEKKLFNYEVLRFLSRSQFMDNISSIAPYGKMTVFCEISMKEDALTLVSHSFRGSEFWAA